jgi:CDGSH-type Zn-finger protein
MSGEITIELREDGPLVVRHLDELRYVDGPEIETKPVLALCRCGRSKSKPFCDGSHAEAEFSGARGTPAGKDAILEYAGEEVSVTYNPRICSHAAECGRLAGHVFDPAQKPWVQPDNGTRAEIEAVVAACPSGALALGRKGQARQHRLDPGRYTIEIERDGPYRVQQIDAPVPPNVQGMSSRKYVLCRCGLSGNKPFCDGTHHDKGWREEG